jgi:protein MpaA
MKTVSKKHAMSAVKAAPFDPPAIAARLELAARAAGFRIEHYGEAAGCPQLALTKRTSGPRPRIYLSAGMHGDEPAPPLTLLALLEAGFFDSRADWFLCPLLNPQGLALGTRENAAGLDLNRDFLDLRAPETRAHVAWLQRQPPFDLTLCIHEDWESTGYYLYELNPCTRPSLAAPILAAVRGCCPIDLAETIDGRPISETGIIRPIDDPLLRETWPEAIYLRAHHTTLSYTLESPSAFPLEQRIAAHRAAIETAVTQLVRDFDKNPAYPPPAQP